MKKTSLKEKLAEQKRICEVMSKVIQSYHEKVDSMQDEIQRVKARAFDLLSESR